MKTIKNLFGLKALTYVAMAMWSFQRKKPRIYVTTSSVGDSLKPFEDTIRLKEIGRASGRERV